ncbi:MAG: carboxypeptidase-like regulatory domain-containing protein, partial [Pedobacter sp.]|nr:carboxypeptidase-like regulatory domain-containing protein [Pedobacter sp.]
MKRLLPILLLFYSFNSIAQVTKITGKITSADNSTPLNNVSIKVKEKVSGTISNSNGTFSLNYNGKLPITVVITAVGFETKEVVITSANQDLAVTLNPQTVMLNEVVSSAARVSQNILQSPVSIEKMSLKTIKENPSFTFYDGLQSLKGMEAVTSSITYKQVNTRGFNTTGNSRFLQLIDGVDNQTPGLNFAIGNLFGASDIDIES